MTAPPESSIGKRSYFHLWVEIALHFGRAGAGCPLLSSQSPEGPLAKPPNFKQEKQRREDAQKKKNAEKQRESAARKENAQRPPKP
jgi:hypothetical protein